MTTETTNGAADATTPAQEFTIRKIYLKDASFEVPQAPEVFSGEWKPETELRLNSQGRELEEGVFEVELTLTITVRNGGNTAYLVEIKQAGLFTVRGFGDEQKRYFLASYCPGVLFPFAREAVADLSGKGGFPSLSLDPINFEALYAQRLQQQQAPDSATTQ